MVEYTLNKKRDFLLAVSKTDNKSELSYLITSKSLDCNDYAEFLNQSFHVGIIVPNTVYENDPYCIELQEGYSVSLDGEIIIITKGSSSWSYANCTIESLLDQPGILLTENKAKQLNLI